MLTNPLNHNYSKIKSIKKLNLPMPSPVSVAKSTQDSEPTRFMAAFFKKSTQFCFP